MGFTIDPARRMVFARIMQVKDPDAPTTSPPNGGTREDVRQRNALYFDGFVEAFTFDGYLVASTRFDNGWDMPWPIGAGAPRNLWYRVTADRMQSIEILRPEMVESTRRR